MRYKLKFEITFPDMDKSEERDAKINLINSEITTEVESEYPIQSPSEKSIVILGDSEYEVVVIRHKLDPDYYTTICYVVDANYILSKREQEMSEQIKRMSKLIKS